MAASSRSLWAACAVVRPVNKISGLMSCFSSLSESTREVRLDLLDGEQEGIAVIAMNRPSRKNALGRVFGSQLSEAVDAIRFDRRIRVAVMRSEVQGVFCAGADLKERAEMNEVEVEQFVAAGRALSARLANLPQPLIAAIDGAAVGGGLEFAMCCDLLVAATTARIGLVETKLAIIPGGGGTQRLPRLVGMSKAKELIFTGRLVNGREAYDVGLVNSVVEQNESETAAFEQAIKLAEEILPQGPIAVRMAKVAINQGMQVDLASGLQFEERCYAQTIPTKDRVEGLRAFKEKRKPVYKAE